MPAGGRSVSICPGCSIGCGIRPIGGPLACRACSIGRCIRAIGGPLTRRTGRIGGSAREEAPAKIVDETFGGGPAYRPGGVFELGQVAISTDPVAADLWAWRVIDRERVRREMPTLEAAGRPPRFIATAADYGLGEGDPSQLVEVEA